MPKTPIPRAKKMEMRREKVRSLLDRGYSYAEIGRMVHPQVSGQAIGRMVKRMGTK